MARVDLSQNEYMERFVGQDHIDSNDAQFWYQLLSCSFNFMRVQDPGAVDKTLEPYLVRLTLSNSQSFNIGSLVRVFLDRVARVKSPNGQSTNPYYVFQTFNGLYLIRTICKSYIENSSEEQLVKSFRAKVDQVSQVSQTPLLLMPPKQLQQSAPATLVQSQTPATPTLTNAHDGAPSHASYQHPQAQQSIDGQMMQIAANHAQLNQNLPATNTTTTSINNSSSSVSDNVAATATTTIPVDGSASSARSPYSIPVQAPQADTTNRLKPVKKPNAEITPGAIILDQFISSLINIIVDIPLNDSTYLLQVEAMNALLVLLSIQMYSKSPANQSVIYKCLMQKQRCSIHALILTKTLLNNFVRQQPIPQEAGSIIIGFASGLWKVLTLGYGSQEETVTESMPLLARQSLLLLNILANHHTTEKNPYREAIVSCQDSKFNLSDPQTALDNANNDALATATTSKSVLMSNSIKIDFHELYETICCFLHDDQVALLLYLLLHSNKIFRPYILTTASTQLDRLIIPLLKILYSSIEKGSHHVYMVLIIFIMLSKETPFNVAINQITIRGVPWYKDRVLNEISLGSLTALIIIRSFQLNTFRIKDQFLHSNLFAILANLSNHFNNLHPYVCQRLVDLLERLSKRYLMATKPAGRQAQILDVLDSNNPLAKALATDTHRLDLQDASAIELDSTSGCTTTTVSGGTSSFNQNGNSQIEINIDVPEQQVSAAASNNNNIVLPPVDIHDQELKISDNSSQQSPNINSYSDHINISIDNTKQDLNLIEEVIRMTLQVLDNSLATQLMSNPNLIYTMLYKRSVFSSLLSSHQSFYNMVINVERILTFFYNKIEALGRPLSVDEIKQIIRNSSEEILISDKKWNFLVDKDPNSQEQSSRLLFQYVEDEQPEEFFIPYIWTRIYYSSGIIWNSKRITLFNPHDL